jgi:hypothetical protein
MSEILTATNIINMDGVLLTLEKGQYYIVKGNVDYKNTDLLKPKTESPQRPNSLQEIKTTNE